MAFITWTNEYSVNVEEIDEQHQHLFNLINRMYDVMIKKAARTQLVHLLDELVDYTSYHFNIEEELLKSHHYPGIENHQHQHDEIALRIYEFQKTFRQGSHRFSLEILVFLSDWVLNHILKSDQKYSYFLNSKGVF